MKQTIDDQNKKLKKYNSILGKRLAKHPDLMKLIMEDVGNQIQGGN